MWVYRWCILLPCHLFIIGTFSLYNQFLTWNTYFPLFMEIVFSENYSISISKTSLIFFIFFKLIITWSWKVFLIWYVKKNTNLWICCFLVFQWHIGFILFNYFYFYPFQFFLPLFCLMNTCLFSFGNMTNWLFLLVSWHNNRLIMLWICSSECCNF